jgi:hypothetical protein
MAERKSDKVLIGDPTREKWAAFLNCAFESGYINQAEHEEQVATVLAARTMGDICKVTKDFSREDCEDWTDYWERLRKKGARQKCGIQIPAVTSPQPDKPGRRFVLLALGVMGLWALAATIFLIVTVAL